MRRHITLSRDLPRRAVARLNAIGVSAAKAQLWLDRHRIDGCTVAPDLFLPVCAVHDYLCRSGVVWRNEADDCGRDLIQILTSAAIQDSWESEDELPWRILSCAVLALGYPYSYLWWAGVVLGDWLGIGAPEKG